MPRELSGGMSMRVSIARALVTAAPGSADGRAFRGARRDHAVQAQRRSAGRWQGERGTTIVFVTHSVFESVFLSNRIVVMAVRPGRVSEIAIDAPYPRDETFRTSPDYAALCRQASGVLGEAITLGGGSNDGH